MRLISLAAQVVIQTVETVSPVDGCTLYLMTELIHHPINRPPSTHKSRPSFLFSPLVLSVPPGLLQLTLGLLRSSPFFVL